MLVYGSSCILPCFLFLLYFFSFIPLTAQDKVEYEEIPVFLDVPRLGGTEMDAVIKGDELYLPVTDLFDFLKIKNVPAPGLESVTGFFISPDAPFLISRTDNTYNISG